MVSEEIVFQLIALLISSPARVDIRCCQRQLPGTLCLARLHWLHVVAIARISTSLASSTLILGFAPCFFFATIEKVWRFLRSS